MLRTLQISVASMNSREIFSIVTRITLNICIMFQNRSPIHREVIRETVSSTECQYGIGPVSKRCRITAVSRCTQGKINWNVKMNLLVHSRRYILKLLKMSHMVVSAQSC
jgi:hypothetical protein